MKAFAPVMPPQLPSNLGLASLVLDSLIQDVAIVDETIVGVITQVEIDMARLRRAGLTTYSFKNPSIFDCVFDACLFYRR